MTREDLQRAMGPSFSEQLGQTGEIDYSLFDPEEQRDTLRELARKQHMMLRHIAHALYTEGAELSDFGKQKLCELLALWPEEEK